MCALPHSQGKDVDEDDGTVVNRGKRRRAWEEEEEANLDEIARKEAEQMLKGACSVLSRRDALRWSRCMHGAICMSCVCLAVSS